MTALFVDLMQKKICEKKNWGAASKGISSKLIPLSSFIKGSEIDQYRIACFINEMAN